jgi:hypothetical protein
MNYRLEKIKNNRKQLIYNLKNYLKTLNENSSFFGYNFKLSFSFNKLVVLLAQNETGLALQVHIVIEDNGGRNVVEHFTLYQDPGIATLSPRLNETALTAIILQGLNFLFFLATRQLLTTLPFYLWHEEAEHLFCMKIFFKEMSAVVKYVSFKMPTKTTDYDSFIHATQAIFMQHHQELCQLRKKDKDVKQFLHTKELIKNFRETTHFSESHPVSINLGQVIPFASTLRGKLRP